ncbi:MAG: hypothetical protein K2V38_04490 [Gemmataceae bacterium]|nr:hypothetical protein [Gemmataceae bacterium]
MRNQVDYTISAFEQLNRLIAAATNPDEVERVAAQLEQCLVWYDARLDPDHTTNCGDVRGPGLLPFPHFTARSIEVAPLRFYFMTDRAR